MAAFIAEKVCALPFELEESFNAFLRAFILNGLDILYRIKNITVLPFSLETPNMHWCEPGRTASSAS